ncbi:glycosyltransferase family 4 protein, partial [Vibrio hyugaensis]|uniref:glycosyltransferase family 4 protein n=1 Tax=Vibrio hyugaensis TaxID=1534743 RepID=UPI000CE4B353
MKLFYFCSDFYPSGTGFAVSFTNFIQYVIDSEKYDEIIIFTTNVDAELPDEFKIHNVKLEYFSSIGELKIARIFKSKIILDLFSKVRFSQLLKLIKTYEVSSDDSFFYEEFYFGNLKKIIQNKYSENKHTIRVHGTMPEFVTFDASNHYRKIFFEQAFSGPLNVATTTSFYIDFINDNLLDRQYDRIKNINYLILPNAIHPSLMKEDEKHNKSQLFGKKIRLLQLGRMDDGGYFQKGFEDTLRALDFLSQKTRLNNIRLDIIGSGSKSSEFDSLVKFLSIDDIKRHDKLKNNEVRELIELADIILLPSRCEGMSMFAVEAITMGKALITTKNTGLKDICIDGFNCLKFEAFNYIQYSEAIEKLLTDHELRIKLQENNTVLI